MRAHQRRVVAEKAALDKKLAGLKAFFGTETYGKLPFVERDRLERQSWAMNEYSAILGSRIAWFKAEEESKKPGRKPGKKAKETPVPGYTDAALPGNASLAQLWHIGGVR